VEPPAGGLTTVSQRFAMISGIWLYSKENPAKSLPAIVKDLGANAVYWNRCYEPYAIARDKELKASLQKHGIEAQSFNGSLLHEPWEIETRAGRARTAPPRWLASSYIRY